MAVRVFVCVLLIYFGYINSLFIVPERALAEYVNPKYATNANITVRRANRRGNYYLNLYGRILHAWGNNVSLHFVCFEFVSNEFRRSFIEMNLKICSMLHSEPYFGGMIKKALNSSTCPIPAGTYNLTDMVIYLGNKYVWPFNRFKVEFTIKQWPTGDIISNGYAILNIKEERKKKTKNLLIATSK